MMRTPEQVITDTIRFDHKPGTNAKRILMALKVQGYRIEGPAFKLSETNRVYNHTSGGSVSLQPSRPRTANYGALPPRGQQTSTLRSAASDHPAR